MASIFLTLALLQDVAIAEIEPWQEVRVDYLEVNSCCRHVMLEQIIFFDVCWDRTEKRWRVVDRGWCYQGDALLTEIDGKPAVMILNRRLTVTADEVYRTVTDFDPELCIRDDVKWIQ